MVQWAARVFAGQKSLGWDVALTDSGPLLLEGNWHYDLTVNQLAHRRGILDTPWVEVFNRDDAWRFLGLGFANRQSVTGHAACAMRCGGRSARDRGNRRPRGLSG